MKMLKKYMIGYFKGLVMTQDKDIFMSGKNVGLNGLNTVSHACSMNHKQLMNMHLWNGH